MIRFLELMLAWLRRPAERLPGARLADAQAIELAQAAVAAMPRPPRLTKASRELCGDSWGGNAFDNRATIYTDSGDGVRLNDGVARYAADASARPSHPRLHRVRGWRDRGGLRSAPAEAVDGGEAAGACGDLSS